MFVRLFAVDFIAQKVLSQHGVLNRWMRSLFSSCNFHTIVWFQLSVFLDPLERRRGFITVWCVASTKWEDILLFSLRIVFCHQWCLCLHGMIPQGEMCPLVSEEKPCYATLITCRWERHQWGFFSFRLLSSLRLFVRRTWCGEPNDHSLMRR